MPAEDMMIPIAEVVTARATDTVEQAMTLLDQHYVRFLPVVDEEGRLQGMFGTHVLLKNLLPVSVTMEDGLQRLDFVIGAAPGVSKRLHKLLPVEIGTILQRDPVVVHSDTATWEVIRLIVRHGSPLPVVEEKTGKLLGIVTEQSIIADMNRAVEDVARDHSTPGPKSGGETSGKKK
jgi:CBS-domain-containing membrane protein